MTTEAVTVVGWLTEQEAEGRKESVGGMGGFFNRDEGDGMRWRHYLDIWDDEVHPHVEAIRAAILEGRIRRGGNWHQSRGIPLFSDGTVAYFSFRAWGDLSAAVWSEAEDHDYSYMDFYMDGWGTAIEEDDDDSEV